MYSSDAGISHGVEFVNRNWFRGQFFLEDFPDDSEGVMYVGRCLDGVYEVIDASKFPELVNLACKRAIETAESTNVNLFDLEVSERRLEGQLYEIPADSSPPDLASDPDGVIWTGEGVFFPAYRNTRITRDEFIARYLDAETVDEYYSIIYGE